MSDDSIKSAIQALCQKIYDRDGCVKPSVLLEQAREQIDIAIALVAEAKKSKGLAKQGFEWDDEKAHQEYLLEQAREQIDIAIVIHEGCPSHLVYVPPAEDEDDHKPAEVIVERPSDKYLQ